MKRPKLETIVKLGSDQRPQQITASCVSLVPIRKSPDLLAGFSDQQVVDRAQNISPTTMDVRAEFDRITADMNQEEICSTSLAVVEQYWYDAPNTTTPPPVLVTAGLELNAQHQPIDNNGGWYNACVPLGEDTPIFEGLQSTVSAHSMYDGAMHAEDMQPDYPWSQAGAYSQRQYLPFTSSLDGVTSAAAVGHAAAAPPPPPPPHSNNNLPVLSLREGQKLGFIGFLNGQPLYRIEEDDFAPPVAAAPPPKASTSMYRKRRKFVKQDDEQDDQPYVARPLNAFMLFLKEHRPAVKLSQCDESGGSAAVNAILGQRWSSMTSEDKAKYYDMAQKEKQLHAQQHPDWTNNYGKKRKRCRKKVKVEEPAFNSDA